jgi:hypothetical protein
MVRTHILKTDPYVWDLVDSRQKTYELRFNDRYFREGDILILDRTQYTGAEMKAGAPLIYDVRGIKCVIKHVLHGPIYGLEDGWCLLSIGDIITISLHDWDRIARSEHGRAGMTQLRERAWSDCLGGLYKYNENKEG